MNRKLTCIICPRGCSLNVELSADRVIVSGHSCPKGEQYAVNECLHPVRTVTATVRVANRSNTMLSVKTEMPVAKEDMMKVMAALRSIAVNAPVRIGAVIMTDVCGSRIIATKSVD